MVIRLSLLIMSLSAAAQAESVPDPTRPPAGVDASAPVSAPSGPSLQLIRTVEGKRMAIISGQAVKVGSKVNDAIVTQIEEDRVELRGAGGVQTLKLLPEVNKSPAAAGQSEVKPQAKKPAKRAIRKDEK